MPEPIYNPAKKRKRQFLEELLTVIDERVGPEFYQLSSREQAAIYPTIREEVLKRCRD